MYKRQHLEFDQKQNLNIQGKKSINLPLGEIKISRKVKALTVIFRSCTSVNMLTQSKKRLFEQPKIEYSFRSIKSLIKTINFCKKKYPDLEIKTIIIDDHSSNENLNKIKNLSNKNLYCLSGNQKEHDELDLHLALNYQNRLVSYDKSGAMINGEKVQAPNINLVNTNGAGDALLGAYIALESKLGKLDALIEAVNYASKICSINSPRLI